MDENEMKSLESRLRSWRPRRASATLKWRLFLARATNVPRMIRVAGWLTPATACALLTMLVLNSENAATATGHRPSFHHGDDEQPKLRGLCDQPPVRAKQSLPIYF